MVLALLLGCAAAPTLLAESTLDTNGSEGADEPVAVTEPEAVVETPPEPVAEPGQAVDGPLPRRFDAPRGQLIEAGGRAWVVSSDGVHELGAGGVAADAAASEQLRGLLARHSGDWAVHGGAHLTVSIGSRVRARTLRIGTDAPMPIRDGVKAIVQLESGEEIWIVQRGDRSKVALRGVDRDFSFPSLGRAPGPAVPGLSSGVCAGPIPHRAASNGTMAAVLLMGCHRDANVTLLVRSDGAWSRRSLPPAPFGAEAFALTSDGRAVVAGAPGRIAEERDGQWQVRRLAQSLVSVSQLVIGSDGARWVVGLSGGGGIDSGSDAWLLFRNEAVVELRDPEGARVHVTELAKSRAHGVVASTFARRGGRWLFTER